ncbi:MAG: GTP 3',8-cyclase MoaA [Bacteroidales bacterium]
MFDSYNRNINYLRISVTDRCNLRCVYCMPEEGVKMLHHEDILSYEEIYEIAKTAVGLGIRKIRITGGEPLARKGIASLVRMLSTIPGLEDLAMTTNGTMLDRFAADLKDAGLNRVNISLDTVDPEKYASLTRGGKLEDVFRGVDAALANRLSPVKINCVIKNSRNEPDAAGVTEYAQKMGVEIRYIHQMDLRNGHYSVVEGGDGGDCGRCNRLRLTADGKIKPCLFSDLMFDTRLLGAQEAILQAVGKKPVSGTINCSGHFYNIGG